MAMAINDLIFSEKIRVRLFRHVLFWNVYGVLFHFQNNNRSFLYFSSFLPACIFAVYYLLYFLLPILKQRKYTRFAFGLLTLYLITFLLDLFGSYLFFNEWDNPVSLKMIIGLALHNQLIALCTGGMAMGIKVTKIWYVRQKENLALENQKAKNEIELNKANLYPEFILLALHSLEVKIANGETSAPAFLLKLSDTLSYILYDSQEALIELDKELIILKNMIEFKRTHGSGQGTIYLSTTGNPENKSIAPLTLFRLIENLFQIIRKEENRINDLVLIINIKNKALFFHLIGKCTFEKDRLINWHTMVTKTRTHLREMYPGASKLKVRDDESSFTISFRLGITNTLNYPQSILNHHQNKEHVLA